MAASLSCLKAEKDLSNYMNGVRRPDPRTGLYLLESDILLSELNGSLHLKEGRERRGKPHERDERGRERKHARTVRDSVGIRKE